MTDHEKTKPIVTDVAFGIRRTIQEKYPGTEREGFGYDKATGAYRTKHSTDDVDIEISVTPKKVEISD